MMPRLMFTAVIAAVLTVPVLAQVEQRELEGVRNYSRVDATVGCAGAVDAAAMPALRREGYRAVVNLRQATEPGAEVDASRAAAQAAGLTYIHLPFNPAAPDPEIVERFLAAVATPANQPVFIHCGSANRVGAVWMIKRVLQDGWTVERAATEAEAIGLTSPQLRQFATEYIAARR